MQVEQFAAALAETVQQTMNENGEKGGKIEKTRYHVIQKNNGVIRHSLMLYGEDENIVPSIPIDGYFEKYRNGQSMTEIAKEIEGLLDDPKRRLCANDINFSYEAIRHQIIFRLVHYEKNKERLKEIPHVRLLDLAVTFHVLVMQEGKEIGTFQINQDHLDMWGTNQEEIRRLATENTPRLFRARIQSMDELLGIWGNGIPMYVISNELGINGASVVLYPTVLKELSEKLVADLYLLPSSIHEFIAVPVQEEYDSVTLQKIVQEVNCTQVPEEDYLSDTVYFYDRQKSMIVKAES